jgi:hypothetical protein
MENHTQINELAQNKTKQNKTDIIVQEQTSSSSTGSENTPYVSFLQENRKPTSDKVRGAESNLKGRRSREHSNSLLQPIKDEDQ